MEAQKKFVSISKGLIVAVLTTSTAVTTILTMIQMTLEYQVKSAELDSIVSGMQGSLVPALEDKLWDMDYAGAQSQLVSLIKSIDASSIVLRSDKNEVLFEDAIPDFIPKFPYRKVFPITAARHQETTTVMGNLEIVFFKDKIVTEVRNRFLIVLFLNGLKTAIVASVLLIIFHRRIAGPILEITRYFNTHKDLARISGVDFQISDRRNYDEISVMGEHIALREKALARWADEQQARVDAATEALAEADQTIRQEKIRSEASARLAQLGEMATSIAHEINNPLAIISGYNHLIRREIKGPSVDLDKVFATTESIEATIVRITKIITGLRAYARDGAQDPMVTTPVQQIIDDTVAMTETRLRTNGVIFRQNFASDSTLMINCRSVQIVQVLVALINNAVDAIKGRSELWIELGSKVSDGMVELSVTDCGDGIPRDIEAKIFEPFFTTKQVGHGTGLGLSISYGIVKDHGGQIFVDHSCRNTRFCIRLPIAAMPA